MMLRHMMIALGGVCAVALAPVATAEPVSDAFTYQGRLESSGAPAQGLHDFRFTLYTAASGGAVVGSTVAVDGLLVQDGLFTIQLDFGPDAFDGERRFLEVEVRAVNPLNPPPFETLSPRQEITPAPHSNFSVNTRGLIVDDFERVGIGGDAPLDNLHVGGPFPGLMIAPGTGPEIHAFASDSTASTTWANDLGNDTVFISSAGSGDAGFIQVRNSTGAIRANLDADLGGVSAGFLGLNNSAGLQTVMVNSEATAGGGSMIAMQNSAGVETITFEAEEFANNGSAIKLMNAAGDTTIELDGDFGSDGRVITSELQITGGSDLSEQFDVSSDGVEPEPGMVVCIDPLNAGELAVSSEAHDKRVAGVISGAGDVKPGMLMGQRGTKADGEHPVALTGRVYVWCDASEAPIEPGDLLTTSDVPGHAMKVADYGQAMGAVVGKAMTPLESGRGLVLVLVSLQ